MLQHQFPDKTASVGSAALPTPGLLITATIPDGVPASSPAFAKHNSRGTNRSGVQGGI